MSGMAQASKTITEAAGLDTMATNCPPRCDPPLAPVQAQVMGLQGAEGTRLLL